MAARKRDKNKKDKDEKEKDKKNEQEEEREPALSPETRSSILVVIFGAVGILSLLAFFDNAGQAGSLFKRAVDFLFGQAAFVVPLVFFGAAIAALATFHKKRHLHLYFGIGLIAVSVLGYFEILMNGAKTGGVIGYGVAYPFIQFFSVGAAAVVFGAALLIGLLVAFDVSLRRVREEIEVPPASTEAPENEEGSVSVKQSDNEQVDKKSPGEDSEKGGLFGGLRSRGKKGEQKKQQKSEKQGASPGEQNTKQKESPEPPKLDKSYQPPGLDLLKEEGGTPSAGDIRANKNIIKRTLDEFGIEVEMQDVNIGPSVTQYTLKPDSGVKLERITSLQRNLSLALAAHPLRIEAPIPGKPLVGIEIPNQKASIVRLHSILKQISKSSSSNLSIGLGHDVRGNSVIADLAKMPHLLVAGSTGSGKSIAINNIILTYTYLNSPRTLRFILIDPKRVELSPYNGIPHLMTPVVTQPQKAINALKWALQEMDSRYDKLSQMGARDITSFNQKVKNRSDFEYLPYIVIVIDELADLMAQYKREMESAVVRLAQMARAVGIHLIASTQRPSTDVVTGLIKANITSRISFKVASQVDSRTIMDQAGAEKLLGNGDMLYMSNDSSGITRVQGTFVSEEEIKKVTEYLRNLDEADYEEEVLSGEQEGGESIQEQQEEEEDDLYEDAKNIVVEENKGSASLLQRRLRIGYARAANLLDALEENGVVGPARGSKPRKVLAGQDDDQQEG